MENLANQGERDLEKELSILQELLVSYGVSGTVPTRDIRDLTTVMLIGEMEEGAFNSLVANVDSEKVEIFAGWVASGFAHESGRAVSYRYAKNPCFCLKEKISK